MNKTKKRYKVTMYVDSADWDHRCIQREVNLAINAAIQSNLIEITHVCYVRAERVKTNNQQKQQTT